MKQRFDQLRSDAWSLPEGKQKLAVLEEAIRIADLYMSTEDAYHARMSYSSSALDSGFQERFLVSFAWCLTQFEKEPSTYYSFSIIWHYKWFVNQIWRFPQFGAAQIQAVIDDFKEKCLQYGHSLRPYYQTLHRYALSRGDMEAAQLNYDLWRKTARDGMSDCSACEQNGFGYYHFTAGRYRRGLQAMRPIMDGRMTCKSIPQNTYSHLLLPLLETGQAEEAMKIAKKGARLLKGPGYLEEYGNFLAYYAATDIHKAAKWFEQTFAYAVETKVGWDRFLYMSSAQAFLMKWHGQKRRRKLNVGSKITYEMIEQDAKSLAHAFDRRNENNYCTELLKQRMKQVQKLSNG
ncbi:hypothetical protein [Paenibacillus sp. FJAT-27812]|uniref:hypothetical protein n=1 Tax=Paenibacillus sp. FJAT-27812 TaxID=1684143 RepID=UPI0006A79A4E|nr:hypothetical protein [Paenibacillus sp. FJAT-27812]